MNHPHANVTGKKCDEDVLALRVEDVACMLSIGRTKAWGLVSSGEIKSFSIGSRRLILRDEVSAYIAKVTAA